MQCFESSSSSFPMYSTLFRSGDGGGTGSGYSNHNHNHNHNGNNNDNLSELEQDIHLQNAAAAATLSRSSFLSSKTTCVAGDASQPLHFGTNINCPDVSVVESSQYSFLKGTAGSVVGLFESWGDSGMVPTSPRTDTSTDIDTDEKNQILVYGGVQNGSLPSLESVDRPKERTGDQKTLRRLAQNREAARKSRLRKKAYVQQLESSRLKLAQLEQELQRARQQGIFISPGCTGDPSHSAGGLNGGLAFDIEYARWLEEHQRQTNDLRSALDSRVGDNELRLLVDGVMAHYDEIFKLKGIAAKSDVFHMLSGMWKTPAERCFMWLGGFRSSELLKLLANQLEPLTDQQLVGICNLQQSSQQAEDALSQGMEALQQSLAETLASGSLGPTSCGIVADYMGQMAIAMSKLGKLEDFLRQADLLRQQTLQQMHRILTTRQAARALLAIGDYFSRLRALSSLWLARPRE